VKTLPAYAAVARTRKSSAVARIICFINPSYQPHSHKPDILTFKLFFLKKRNFQIPCDSQISCDSKMTGVEQIITAVCEDDGFMQFFAAASIGRGPGADRGGGTDAPTISVQQ
jgi:hypothetical protein